MINRQNALKHLMDLLKIEGLSGREGNVAAAIREKLMAAGCRQAWIKHDRSHKKISGEFDVGNLIVKLPGTIRDDRRLFMGHMDTVPLCRGAVPAKRGNRIVSKDQTALGADNRTAVACMVSVIETIVKKDLPRPPLTFLFTIAEEIGLLGAKCVDVNDLGNPAMGFNIDSGDPNHMMIAAIGADRWEVDVLGISAHAGVHPEDGISAAAITALAIADVVKRGYFGKVVKGRKRGTSNVGSMEGGEASNQVTDLVRITGESRSHDNAFLKEITSAYKTAFQKAAKQVKNKAGKTGRIRFKSEKDYDAFKMDRKSPAVKHAVKVAEVLGLKPKLTSVDGGLDANYMNQKGIPTITLGAGQHHPHTVNEYVDIKEYITGCELALALATGT
jgi:tripeptide aminopeptidase